MPTDYKALPSNFPPTGPTGLTKVIPSYLYQQFTDDDDLQAITDEQNKYQQTYVDAFNTVNLPIYTGPLIANHLLDWVGQGIYGYARPSLYSGFDLYYGTFDTAKFNEIYFNSLEIKNQGPNAIANDDIYKRALTWHFYKGDGKYFNVRWLKRRVLRFIYGTDGTDPIDKTVGNTQISISFGPQRKITIRFVLNIRKVTTAAVYNNSGFTFNNMQFNQINSTYSRLPDLPFMDIFQQAVLSGALELPFQYSFQIQIG